MNFSVQQVNVFQEKIVLSEESYVPDICKQNILLIYYYILYTTKT